MRWRNLQFFWINLILNWRYGVTDSTEYPEVALRTTNNGQIAPDSLEIFTRSASENSAEEELTDQYDYPTYFGNDMSGEFTEKLVQRTTHNDEASAEALKHIENLDEGSGNPRTERSFEEISNQTKTNNVVNLDPKMSSRNLVTKLVPVTDENSKHVSEDELEKDENMHDADGSKDILDMGSTSPITEITIIETINGKTVERKPTQEELREIENENLQMSSVESDLFQRDAEEIKDENKENTDSQNGSTSVEDVSTFLSMDPSFVDFSGDSSDDNYEIDDMEVIFNNEDENINNKVDENSNYDDRQEKNEEYENNPINGLEKEFLSPTGDFRQIIHTETKNFTNVKEINFTISEREGEFVDTIPLRQKDISAPRPKEKNFEYNDTDIPITNKKDSLSVDIFNIIPLKGNTDVKNTDESEENEAPTEESDVVVFTSKIYSVVDPDEDKVEAVKEIALSVDQPLELITNATVSTTNSSIKDGTSKQQEVTTSLPLTDISISTTENNLVSEGTIMTTQKETNEITTVFADDSYSTTQVSTQENSFDTEATRTTGQSASADNSLYISTTTNENSINTEKTVTTEDQILVEETTSNIIETNGDTSTIEATTSQKELVLNKASTDLGVVTIRPNETINTEENTNAERETLAENGISVHNLNEIMTLVENGYIEIKNEDQEHSSHSSSNSRTTVTDVSSIIPNLDENVLASTDIPVVQQNSEDNSYSAQESTTAKQNADDRSTETTTEYLYQYISTSSSNDPVSSSNGRTTVTDVGSIIPKLDENVLASTDTPVAQQNSEENISSAQESTTAKQNADDRSTETTTEYIYQYISTNSSSNPVSSSNGRTTVTDVSSIISNLDENVLASTVITVTQQNSEENISSVEESTTAKQNADDRSTETTTKYLDQYISTRSSSDRVSSSNGRTTVTDVSSIISNLDENVLASTDITVTQQNPEEDIFSVEESTTAKQNADDTSTEPTTEYLDQYTSTSGSSDPVRTEESITIPVDISTISVDTAFTLSRGFNTSTLPEILTELPLDKNTESSSNANELTSIKTIGSNFEDIDETKKSSTITENILGQVTESPTSIATDTVYNSTNEPKEVEGFTTHEPFITNKTTDEVMPMTIPEIDVHTTSAIPTGIDFDLSPADVESILNSQIEQHELIDDYEIKESYDKENTDSWTIFGNPSVKVENEINKEIEEKMISAKLEKQILEDEATPSTSHFGANLGKNEENRRIIKMIPLLKATILNNSAEFSVKLSKKDDTFYIPASAYIKEYDNIVNITWRADEHMNNSLAMRIFQKDEFYMIKEIMVYIFSGNKFVDQHKPVAFSPDPVLDDTMLGRSRVVMMRDGTYITLSNVEFLKKSFINSRENLEAAVGEPKIYRIKVASISVAVFFVIAIGFYIIVVLKRKTKETLCLNTKEELPQVTHC